jgi:excisionase family DNA binding protein
VKAAVVQMPGVEARTEPVVDSPWWTVDEAATYARQHKQVLYRACRERKVQHVKVGGRGKVLFKKEFIDAWLMSLQVHVRPA